MEKFIEIIDLNKSYKSLNVLNKLNLTIDQGEFICIMGANGSGKTTLLKLIAGMTLPQSGVIKVNGANILQFDQHQKEFYRGNMISYICQQSNLLDSLRNIDNIFLSLAGKQDINQKYFHLLIEAFGIADILKKYPGQCSQGQQQKVSIVRALIQKPKILLADEATAHLDWNNVLFVYDYLKKEAHMNKTTVICITHDYILASHSDRSLYLKNGKLQEMTKSS